MKLTVTTSSQTLQQIIDWDADAAIINGLLSNGYVNLTITNNGANAVYKEMGKAATVADSVIIASWGWTKTFKIKNVWDIHLISTVASVDIDCDFNY